jgi:hypothetical protein
LKNDDETVLIPVLSEALDILGLLQAENLSRRTQRRDGCGTRLRSGFFRLHLNAAANFSDN